MNDPSKHHHSPGKTERKALLPTQQEVQSGGKVLLADDEKFVREPFAEMLRRAGYRILTASDGPDAVAIFREHSEEIVAVLLDYYMPSGPGDKVFEALQSIRPGVPVIMMSGAAEEEVMGRFLGLGIVGFLQKPFGRTTLLDKVREAIEPQAA